MLHTKSKGHEPSGCGEDFPKVLTIYGRGGPTYSCDQDHLNTLLFPRPKESLDPVFQRRCLNMLTDGVTGILLASAQVS